MTQDTLTTEHRERVFLSYIMRHLGCLAVTYVALDRDGLPQGDERVATYSGFFIVVDGRWFFVTAGHVFDDPDEGLEVLRTKRRIQVLQASLLDYFGVDAVVPHPTIISYEEVPKIYVDRGKTLGLDFALLPLRDFYVAGVQSNNVKPFEERNWQLEGRADAIAYGILGFPNEETSAIDTDTKVGVHIRPIFVRIEKCDPPEDAPKTTYPLFVARLLSPQPVTVKGMSGGPILGLRKEPNGTTGYWVAALQAHWKKSDRIIYGCPMTTVINVFRQAIQAAGLKVAAPTP